MIAANTKLLSASAQLSAVKTVKPLKSAVTLASMKAHKDLKAMALIKQSRLSVSPVTKQEWNIICDLGGISA